MGLTAYHDRGDVRSVFCDGRLALASPDL